MFDSTFVDNTDVSSLAKHRLALSKSSSLPQINVNFAGLAEILQLPKPSSAETPHSPKKLFQPKVTLSVFCTMYGLSAAIETKLHSLGITGPHSLRYYKFFNLLKTRSLSTQAIWHFLIN
jgi:hypothetical protein